MEKYEQLIQQLFLQKKLEDIEFFDHDLRYFSPNNDQTWIVDGGVQFMIENRYISFAYSAEHQFFNIFLSKAEEISDNFRMNALGAREVAGIESLIGKTITRVEAKWNFYQDLDEDFEPTGEKKYMPFELILTFDSHDFLQISAVEFGIVDKEIVDLQYNSERDLLISLNKKFAISSGMAE